MKEFVVSLLNISGQAAIIFAVLLVVRGIFALGRVPKKYAYGLWAILFIRLLLPVQIEARWGLMPRESVLVRAVEGMANTASQGERGNTASGNPAGNIQFDAGRDIQENRQSMPEEWEIPMNWQSIYESRDTSAEQYGIHGVGQDAQSVWPKNMFEQTASGFRQFSVWTAAVCLWAAGIALFMGHGLLSYLRLKRKICCSLRLEGWGEGIYLADDIETPFVFGFIVPGIYLPSNMAEKNYPYVIAHERIHIRRRDYLVKLGVYLLTCLYWFHPLVWAGFILLSRDMETSCDEAVLRQMGGGCREEYADSLLQLACGKRYPTAAPLAFGEGDIRGRIKHIMGYRKASAAAAIAPVVLTGILAAVLLVSPRKEAEESNGDFQQDPLAPELMEEEGMSEGDTGLVDSQTPVGGEGEFSFQVAYRDIISCPVPVMTGDTSLGADGAILDYADEDKIVFHGYFGLYIYSVSAGEIIGKVDLRALGCGDTQGDNACQVLVSRDGSKVYFYPMGGINDMQGGDMEHVIYSYVYDIQSGRLRIGSWNLEQPGDSDEKIQFHQLMEGELAESRGVLMEQWERSAWEQGFFSDYGIVCEKDGETVLGYLKSASGTLEDLVYVQRPVYGENPGAVNEGSGQYEAIGLFGGNGQGASTVSYGQEPTCIMIDGTTYDLCQVMTECLLGDEMLELPQGNDSINAITGLQYADGLWIVEGHINPSRNIYSFYDPSVGDWIGHIVGNCLTWRRNITDERQVLWEEKRDSLLSTVIYALDDKIYSLQEGLLMFLPLELAEQDGVPQEEIFGLSWQGDEVTVAVRSTQSEESRILRFHYGGMEWE